MKGFLITSWCQMWSPQTPTLIYRCRIKFSLSLCTILSFSLCLSIPLSLHFTEKHHLCVLRFAWSPLQEAFHSLSVQLHPPLPCTPPPPLSSILLRAKTSTPLYVSLRLPYTKPARHWEDREGERGIRKSCVCLSEPADRRPSVGSHEKWGRP